MYLILANQKFSFEKTIHSCLRNCTSLYLNLMKLLSADITKLVVYGILISFSYSCTPKPKINHIQVIASHNSYKLPIEPQLMEILTERDSARFNSLDYGHIPLSDQLDLGLRKLEIDIYHDPDGGRYARPFGRRMLVNEGKDTLPYDPEHKMRQKGFKVLHVQDVDYRSSCLLITDCLGEILTWSEQHPRHLPIVISFNLKTEAFPEQPDFVIPFPFTDDTFRLLEESILSIIPRKRIITPDDVRGEAPSLKEAVLSYGWPELVKAKDKFIFVIDEPADKVAPYIDGHPSLSGRLMFVNADPKSDEAAFLIINDPIADKARIQQYVRQGFLVRTRADADTKEARKGDYSRFEAALESGAQYISTDYYLPDARFGHQYHINIPGGQNYRPNPIYK